MSSIETRIAEWRTRMAQALPQRHEALAELEEHLREHFAHLQRQGIPDDEAFARAQERIGEPQAVAREFARMPAGWRPGLIVLPILALFWAFYLGSNLWPKPHRLPVTALHVIWLVASAGFFGVLGAGLIATCAFLKTAWHPLSERERVAVHRLLTKLAWFAGIFVTAGWVFGTLWQGALWPYQMRLGLLVSLALFILVQSRPAISDRVRWLMATFPFFVALLINLGRFFRVAGVSLAWLCVAFILVQIFFVLPRFRIRIERLREPN
jgi:hypothetical protein